MGFFNNIFSTVPSNSKVTKRPKSLRKHVCRFEEVEQRELLSATPYSAPDPINVGVVYHEDYYEGLNGDKGDIGGDTFTISWNGGAQGTTLDRVVIDLNKSPEFGNSSSVHFNIDGRIPNPYGTYYDFNANIAENQGNGITVKSKSVSADGKVLTIEFEGFTSDKQFFFKIDVDEINGEIIPTVDRLVSGKEMEGAKFSGVFSNTRYASSSFEFKMLDRYTIDPATHLNLPPDAYYPVPDDHDNTAGAIGTLDVQTPLPGSISGYVYEDVSNDGIKDTGEKGISGVWLRLFVKNDAGQYVDAGYNSVQTDASGYYLFSNVAGGKTYKVVETQPVAYADGKDTPGTIGLDTVGVAIPPDDLAEIHIGASEHGVNYNFGELKYASLSGYVYHDRNNNGVKETGEEGIPGVRLQLQVLNSAGQYTDVVGAVTTTGSDGKYLFENLDPFKTYRVVEEQPTGWVDGLETVGKVNGTVVGSTTQDDKIGNIVLNFGEEGIDYNFGELKAASLSGFVYHDRNNNGQRESGEEGISGVQLQLQVLGSDGKYTNVPNVSVLTGANGQYLFTNLDPFKTYQVVETQPANWKDGLETVGKIGGAVVGSTAQDDKIGGILLKSAEEGVDYNFGELQAASLSGFVYHDRNNNGQRESGEEGISGVQLQLQVLGSDGKYTNVPNVSVLTGANGQYLFTNLDPFKTYQVVEAQPTGWTDGFETVGKVGGVVVGSTAQDDKIGGILLKSGEEGVDYNFGEYKKGSISGTVYEDDNNDGKKDSGEKGLGGVTIYLCYIDENGVQRNITQTVTDADGNYSFDNLLEPGVTYCLTEEQPEDYCSGINAVGTVNGETVGDFKSGSYYDDAMTNIKVGGGDEGINYNFAENRKGSLSGYVYEDVNKNGSKDSGEKGIEKVVLTLWAWDGSKYVQTSKTATTNADGYYEFLGLCPFKKYRIVETQPQNYDDGDETVGSLGGDKSVNDIISEINMPPHGSGVNYNFGELVPPPPLVAGSLSGYVYVDTNNNGVKESAEIGIGGVTLSLERLVNGTYVSTGKTATTNASGYYIFSNLDPNETYKIVETQPTAYDDGKESIGQIGSATVGTLPNPDNDTITNILLPNGGQGTNYNFGELEKSGPPPAKGSLSGYVYVDADENGTKDSGEKGISGVTLTLYKLDNGNYVSTGKTVTTDSNGYYIFADLDPNATYKIAETQPSAYNDGFESIGQIGGKDVGTLPLVDDDTISEIALPEGGVGVNYNFGEFVIDTPPPPPFYPPPPPSIIPPVLAGALGQAGPGATPSWQPPTIGSPMMSNYGGGGLPSGYTWHLSVINAGYPRDADGSGVNITAQSIRAAQNPVAQVAMLSGDRSVKQTTELEDVKAKYVSVAWEPLPMNQSVWYVRDRDGNVKRRFKFGPEGGIPLVGDFNGDGMAELAVFNEGKWYIDLNGNGVWDEQDLWCELGTSTDQPIVGDWDGDGKVDIGIFGPQWTGDAALIADEPGLPSDLNTTVTARPKNMPPTDAKNAPNHTRAMKHSKTGGVRLDVIDHVFQYGGEGDHAFTGDFSGDGVTKIGIYRNGKWYIDKNGNGQWDNEDIYVDNADFGIGTSGIPVVGDFGGNGIDKIGLFVNGTWYLDTSGDFKFDTKVEFGEAGDYPIVGDFEGDGIAQLAVYRAEKMDSLQARAMPSQIPSQRVGDASGPQLERADTSGRVASQYNSDGNLDDNSTGQGTLPKELQQHHKRSGHTPHTNAPLHHHRR